MIMTSQTDRQIGTPLRIERLDAQKMLEKLAAEALQLPRNIEDGDRGLRLRQSHQRQRDIRRQAMGWG
jgi:hypothetical protein